MVTKGSKRSIDCPLKVNKRVKSFTEENSPTHLAKIVKKQILKLSRSEISELISHNLAQLLSSQSQLGDLRRLCGTYAEAIERWKQKAGLLESKCRDMNAVIKRYTLDVQQGSGYNPTPIKITRSVGIQVSTSKKQSSMPNQQYKNLSGQQTPEIVDLTAPTTKETAPESAKESSLTNHHTEAAVEQQPTPKQDENKLVTNTISLRNPLLDFEAISALPTPTKSPIQTTFANGTETKVSESKEAAATIKEDQTKVTNTANEKETYKSVKNKKVVTNKTVKIKDNQPKLTDNSKVCDSSKKIKPKLNVTTPITKTSVVNEIELIELDDDLVEDVHETTVTVQSKLCSKYVSKARGKLQKPLPLAKKDGKTQPSSPSLLKPEVKKQTVANQIVQSVKNQQNTSPTFSLGDFSRKKNLYLKRVIKRSLSHPGPLPELSAAEQKTNPAWKKLPPRPMLRITQSGEKVTLSWHMIFYDLRHAPIKSYEIYAYPESSDALPSSDLWAKLGNVEAFPLPMACTLTELTKGLKYYFAIRGRDEHDRVGLFSSAQKVMV